MSHTQDKEEMKTSIEDQYRASLQRHRAANVVLSLLLLSSVAILAGVILTDGFGLCKQTGLVPVNGLPDPTGKVKRSLGHWGGWRGTVTSTTNPPLVNGCNPGCQPIPQMSTATICSPGQPGCVAGLQRPPGGDVKCGTGAKIVCEEAAFGQQGRPGSSGPAGQPWRPTEAPARLVCLTERDRLGLRGANRNFVDLPPGCIVTDVAVCDN